MNLLLLQHTADRGVAGSPPSERDPGSKKEKTHNKKHDAGCTHTTTHPEMIHCVTVMLMGGVLECSISTLWQNFKLAQLS